MIKCLEKILKSTAKTQIRNFGLFVQTKDGDLILSGVEPTV